MSARPGATPSPPGRHSPTRVREAEAVTQRKERSAGDDARGCPSGLRRRLAGVGARARLAVPGNTVRRDLESYAARLAPDGDPSYVHDSEGPDDMSAHIRSVLTLTSLSIPVEDGRCDLGTWQGVYVWEHRTSPHRRKFTVTVTGDAAG